MLAYLGRYTHRVAIANSRMINMADDRVAFRWRDYRHGARTKVMALDAHQFIRRFLLHMLPDGFHRIRHYGFLANGHRAPKCRKRRCRRRAPGVDASLPMLRRGDGHARHLAVGQAPPNPFWNGHPGQRPLLLLLPPYSADLNPIEMAFAKLKAHLRAGHQNHRRLWQAIGDIPISSLQQNAETTSLPQAMNSHESPPL